MPPRTHRPGGPAATQRFARHLPWVNTVVTNPMMTLLATIAVALAGAIWSVHYALSALLLWLGAFSFYLDRRLLDRVLIPPFALVMVWQAISLGVGVALVIYGDEHRFSRELCTMQVVQIVLYPLAYGVYRLITRRLPPVVFPEENPVFRKQVIQPLVILGWIFFIYRLVQLTVFAITGVEDRGEGGEAVKQEVFGIWTYFNLMPRFSNFGFFLLPLIWRHTAIFGRVVLSVLFGYCMLVGFASGGRGNVFFPVLFIAIGSYLFLDLRRLRLDFVGLVFGLAAMPVIVGMDYFRNTNAYRTSRTFDILDRLAAVKEIGERAEEVKFGGGARSSYTVLGSALIGVSDSLVYERVPDVLPHAGYQNFDAMLYTWVPYFLKRDRPILLDGNAITYELLGIEWTPTGRTISTQADLYRRFGWIGVPLGYAAAWLAYGLFCAYAYRQFVLRNSIWGMLLILYCMSFFNLRPFDTVLTTWWTWFYELPKHLFALLPIYFVARLLSGTGAVRGAMAFVSRPAPAGPPRLAGGRQPSSR